MSAKMFYKLIGIIFAVVAVGHVLRLINGLSITVGTWSVPMWLSVVAAVVLGYLSYTAFKLGGFLK